MAQFVDNLLINLSLNAGKFRVGVKEVVTELTHLDKGIKQSGDKMLLFGSTVANAFAAGAIARGIKSTIDANAALVNQVATAEQVFGDAFETIDKFSESSVEAVGLSKRAAVEATTFLGGLGKAAGLAGEDLAKFSIDMVKLAADLAAAFNTSVADATAAIQSGFSGSSIEPLRRYNVVINDTSLKAEYFALTGEKVSGVLSFQQRQLAFVSQLLKQTADYQGQWNRESDQALAAQQKLAAQVENLKASLGEALIPMFTQVVHGLTGMAGAFEAMPHTAQSLVSALGVGALAAVAANKAITGLENALLGFGMSAQNAGRLAGGLRTGFLLLDAAMIGYSINAAQAANNNKELEKSFGDLSKVNPTTVSDLFGQFVHHELFLDEAETTADAFRDVAERNIASAQLLYDAFKANPAALAAFNAQWEGPDLTLDRMNAALVESAKQLALQGDAATKSTDLVSQFTTGTKDATGATQDSTEALEVNTAAMDTAADAAKDWGEAIKNAGDSTTIALANFRTDQVKNLRQEFLDFLQARPSGVPLVEALDDSHDAFDRLVGVIRRNEHEIPDIFDFHSERAQNFRDAIGEAAAAVDEQLTQAFEHSRGGAKKLQENIDILREQLTRKLVGVTGLDIDVPAEKQKLDAVVNEILPTDAEIHVRLKLAKDAQTKLLADIAVEFAKGIVPTVGTQLEVDLATGGKSPEEVIRTAQRIANRLGVDVEFGLKPKPGAKQKIDRELVDLATKERDAILLKVDIEDLESEKNRINGFIAGPGGKPWPPVELMTKAGQTSEEVKAQLDPIVPDRIDVPIRLVMPDGSTFYPGGGGSPIVVPGGTRALGAVPQAAIAPGFRMPMASAAPIIINATVQAAVVGDPFAVMRAVESAMRRTARIMPTHP